MHDTGDLFDFLMREIHDACLPGPNRILDAVTRNPETGSECTTADACVTHRVFTYRVERHMLCIACGKKTRVSRYSSHSFLVTAAQLRTPGAAFEKALAQTYEVKLACSVEDGGCGAENYETEELQSLPELLVIGKFGL